ncbi:MAG: aspartate carbamoyltransferase catalytic subunit [Legionellales bacterium]|nr:aspartate carbamoyltransferase catalytic subunit [Legionellales bacterium]
MIQQLDDDGNLRHLLSINGLNRQVIQEIFSRAEQLFDKDGALSQLNRLSGKTVANLFFESSTRTRSTFELAAKRLSASVLNLNISTSATSKGESLRDTIRNLEAMQCHLFVVRHGTSGAAQFVAEQVKPGIGVINAGDGRHAHPSQAILDMFTIHKHRGDFSNKCFAIVGDILHSRVARSQIQALHLLGAGEVRLIGPKTLIPADAESLGVKVFHDLKEGLKAVDVIMVLRLQTERMIGTLLPQGNAFYRQYGLTEDSLAYANPNPLIVHPGPMNRGVEIQSEVADGPHAVILDQVTNGVAVRMAIMDWIAQSQATYSN